ncbi:glutamate racemase [Bacteriovorax sp. Seq25_V]|uniref:glutamate racemase n=1 Tax=Bacteriovorax sp. Seq25_V TaxID=1201288 RepID=UPI00038A3F40|nr:glutamate racemase [Bacteriovorax sp. Seq25_V]EQC44238.1 glutamate racemase [Bacteriovorax sp. Seq25_V]
MVKIGIFDSGIGGLSILREIAKLRLGIEMFYFADSLNNPYGQKDDSFVIARCEFIVETLEAKGANLIVVACNTATAIAIDHLREKYPHLVFVGVEPYINVINQRPELKTRRGVVLATPLTGNSKRFKALKERLDPNNLLDVFTPIHLAKLIEDNFFNKSHAFEFDVKKELLGLSNDYDYLILGCTHYPLIKPQLLSFLKGEMISPCPMVAMRVKNLLLGKFGMTEGDASATNFAFYQSGVSSDFKTLNIDEVFI